MSRCDSCGAEILWAFTANGKSMPLDAEPVEKGNLVTMWVDDTFYCRGFGIFDSKDELRYVSHFATCPNADKHRRRP